MPILAYHRPQTLAEALGLLAQVDGAGAGLLAVPLAGGTALDRATPQPLAVIDLQALGLDQVVERGASLEIGAMVTLQALSSAPLPAALRAAINHEATYNLRQVATVGGTLVAASGRSPLTAALLALDAVLTLFPGPEQVGLGDLLPLRQARLPGRLISQISFSTNLRLAYHSVGRTPADLPVVCAALAVWPAGRARLALGGYNPGDAPGAPLLAFDGPNPAGLEIAARSAYSQAGDEWASAEYRSEVATILAARCLQDIEQEDER